MRNRVVVTGFGVISAGGADPSTFAETVSQGLPRFTAVSDPRAPHMNQYAGLVTDEDAIAGLDPRIREYDRHIQLALYAATAALRSAAVQSPLPRDAGIVCATCSGPMSRIEEFYEEAEKGRVSREERFWLQRRYYSVTRTLCHFLGISGPASTITTACSAGTAAMGAAYDLIRLGESEMMLVGGADSFSLSTLAGFNGLKATAETTCAPFSKPVGMNLGEGAGFLVFESLDNARKRGAPVYAEILGFGSSNDAYHCSAPDPSGRGQSLAMQRALADSGLTVSDIAYINAHGTGTGANDKAETRAIIRVFGNDTRVPVSSTKSMIGHCLGAAGTLELIATIICSRKGVMPPTANFSEPREGCTLDYVSDTNRSWPGGSVFMNNNFAFGGNNAGIVVSSGTETHTSPISEKNNVYITGFGIVSPAGIGITPLAHAWENNTRYVERREAVGCSWRLAEVPEFRARDIDRRLDFRSVDRGGIFATAAARLAMLEADCSGRHKAALDYGLYIGQANSVIWAESDHIRDLVRHGYLNNQVQTFPFIVPNSTAGTVSRLLGLGGHSTVISAGPGSDCAAVGSAFHALQAGHGELIIAGGVDELSDAALFDLQQVAHTDWVRDGIGEGAAFMVLETEDHVKQRDADFCARICSFASGGRTETVWGYPNPQDILPVIDRAIKAAGIDAGEIGCISTEWGGEGFESVVQESGLSQVPVVQLRKNIGYVPSCNHIMSLSVLSQSAKFELQRDKNYILSFSATPFGFTYATIFQFVTRKSLLQ